MKSGMSGSYKHTHTHIHTDTQTFADTYTRIRTLMHAYIHILVAQSWYSARHLWESCLPLCLGNLSWATYNVATLVLPALIRNSWWFAFLASWRFGSCLRSSAKNVQHSLYYTILPSRSLAGLPRTPPGLSTRAAVGRTDLSVKPYFANTCYSPNPFWS